VIPCPSCHKPTAEGPACAACGSELRLPLLLDRLGRLCFNRALELEREGDRAGAENQLCAAAALMPLRPESHRALGKLRAQAGRLPDAAAELAIAVQLDPKDEDAREALAAVQRQARRERLLLFGLPALALLLSLASLAGLWFVH